MPTINVGNLKNQEKILDYLSRIYAATFDLSAMDWGAFFASRRTGEVFSTKFYYLSVSDTAQGDRLNASLGKSCVPSTETVKGQDDFAAYNAFWYTDCNFVVTDDGLKVPTCIDGQENFARTGKADVGILTPPLYYGIEQVSDGEIWHLSDSPHPELGLVLMPHCKDNKGNAMPYGILPKYYAGVIDGIMYSSSGLPVKNFTSYQSLHTAMAAKGVGYVGAGSERSIYLKTMLRIKYAYSSSQKVFQGCTSYNFQYAAALAETGVNYITLTKAQAANIVIGNAVSIGEAGDNTTLDRGQTYMRNLADLVRVTRVEDVDDTYSRVYVDAEPFDVTTTTYISSMPLHSGQTDNVLGRDGYVANDGKHAFLLQGLEEGIGAYFVSANELMDKETATKTVFYHRNGGEYTNVLDTVRSDWKAVGSFVKEDSADFWIGEVDIDLETGAEVPRTVGSGSTSGTGDRCYYGGDNTGLREHLSRGHLWSGSGAGLSYLNLGHGVSAGFWLYAGSVS